MIAPSTRCSLCHHREDEHETLPNGSRPCRSIGHAKGLTCRECRRLTEAEHVEAVMGLRDEPDDAFTTAWAAYYATLNHARDQIGSGWQAFFSDVHQSAVASAVLTLRAQSGLPDGPFEESREYGVVGGWGVDGARDAADARRQVQEALAQYPDCGAYARWRVIRTWEDDAQFLGPWQPLTDPEPAEEAAK